MFEYLSLFIVKGLDFIRMCMQIEISNISYLAHFNLWICPQEKKE